MHAIVKVPEILALMNVFKALISMLMIIFKESIRVEKETCHLIQSFSSIYEGNGVQMSWSNATFFKQMILSVYLIRKIILKMLKNIA